MLSQSALLHGLVRALLLLTLPFSQSVAWSGESQADKVADYALQITAAFQRWQKGDRPAAIDMLEETDQPLRGWEYQLLQTAFQADGVGDPAKGIPFIEPPKPDEAFRYAAFDAEHKRLAYLCQDGTVRLLELSQEPGPAPFKVVSDPRKRALYCGEFSRNGATFATGNDKGQVVVWNAETWVELTEIQTGELPVRYLAVNQTGTRLAADGADGVTLWDLADKRRIAKIGDRFNFGGSVCFQNDGNLVATGGLFTAKLCEAENGALAREIQHAPYTMHLLFSPDGRYLASGTRGSVPKRVALFDVGSGATVFDQSSHQKGITGLAFSPDGSRLISVSADETLRFWHVPTGQELLQVPLGSSAFLLSMSNDGRVLLWHRRDGPCYFQVP